MSPARRWRFKPASIDDAPVAAKLRVAIRFVSVPGLERGRASLGLAHDGSALAFDVENVLDAEWYDGEFVYSSRFDTESSAVPQRQVSVGALRNSMATLTLRL